MIPNEETDSPTKSFLKHEDVAKAVRTVRFLVLDEADRMIETGHFAELEKIVKLTLRPSKE